MAVFSKLKPAELAVYLNSFDDIGPVLDEEQAKKNLKKAGSRIAGDPDAKTINGFKYAAWLFDLIQSKEKKGRSPRSYDVIKEAARERAAAASQAGRDIGQVPDCVDPERRERCRRDLRLFLETYFPQNFDKPWSKDHLVVIRKIEDSVLKGGLFALAMPRGSGKSTICERAAIWAVAYGHRKFVVVIGATEEAACGNLAEIKVEFETNDLLYDDFPEICFPVRKIDGINNRCKGQTCCGTRTRIEWSDRDLTLPTIENSFASGAVIRVRGITGSLRGMKAATATGKSLRPDFVLIDDPQTDETAVSPDQNRKRVKILSGAILGLAGPGVKISGVMPCTVIHRGDMADQILDRQKHPEWKGERLKLMIEMPKNMDLWDKYAEIWADSLRENGNIDAATEFYIANREKMDEGAVPSWEARYEDNEISAIQNAMNIYIRDQEIFASEYQNEPSTGEDEELEKIKEIHVTGKMNGRKRDEIPEAAEKLAMFIDVQGKLLYWSVVAFADDFTSWLIDYGAFPDQKRRYFTLRDARPTFKDVYKKAIGLEGAIYSALKDLTDEKLNRTWIKEDGNEIYIEKCIIDSAWGESTDTVYKFCKESEHARILLPSKGRGITAASKPFSEYRKERGSKIGFNWRIFRTRGNSVKLFEYDTNFWKSFFRARLFSSLGDRGTFTIFGNNEDVHKMLAEHLTSEIPTSTTGNGRRVDVWKMIPGRDNHFLDCVVGCMAAASVMGCDLDLTAKHRKVSSSVPDTSDRKKPVSSAPKRITPGKRISVIR